MAHQSCFWFHLTFNIATGNRPVVDLSNQQAVKLLEFSILALEITKSNELEHSLLPHPLVVPITKEKVPLQTPDFRMLNRCEVYFSVLQFS